MWSPAVIRIERRGAVNIKVWRIFHRCSGAAGGTAASWMCSWQIHSNCVMIPRPNGSKSLKSLFSFSLNRCPLEINAVLRAECKKKKKASVRPFTDVPNEVATEWSSKSGRKPCCFLIAVHRKAIGISPFWIKVVHQTNFPLPGAWAPAQLRVNINKFQWLWIKKIQLWKLGWMILFKGFLSSKLKFNWQIMK